MNKLDRLSVVDEESVFFALSGDRPSPMDFEEFLPWACYQLEVQEEVVVTSDKQYNYVSILPRGKSKLGIKNIKQSETSRSPEKLEGTSVIPPDELVFNKNGKNDMVKIIAVYSGENIVKIKFEKNHPVPRKVLKIIGLIIRFHVHLDTISMSTGIDKYTIYEVSKLLCLSNITDVCLDGAFVEEANFSILLDNPTKMRHLSLARCKIDDRVVEQIAAKLTYPMPASKVLALLNLSTNKITDKGAKHLAEALRSNRSLYYLNLAGNIITDSGAKAILNTLQEFCLTDDELLAYRESYVTYLKELEIAKANVRDDIKEELQKKQPKKKHSKPVGKKVVRDIENESPNSTILDSMPVVYEKVEAMARHQVGEFSHPFRKDCVDQRNGAVYSLGNNILCYLNMAYNNLTFLTVTELLHVIQFQKRACRKPIGLITVSIEGNMMPNDCIEFFSIDYLLESGVSKRRDTSAKKRAQAISKIRN